jgi:hypothetical protein
MIGVQQWEDWCPQYAGYHLSYPSRRHLPATLRALIDFTRTASLPTQRALVGAQASARSRPRSPLLNRLHYLMENSFDYLISESAPSSHERSTIH